MRDEAVRLMVRQASICFGCMSIGSSDWRSWVLNEPEATGLLQHAFDRGIRIFDTANVYSGGESERLLGAFIRRFGLRDEIILATKLFHETPDRPGKLGLDRENILGSMDASLQRLGVDHVDLMQIHRWDDLVPIEETMAALGELVKAGKTRFIGACNVQAWQLAKAQLVARDQGWEGFSTFQPHYNLLYREDERDLIPFCRDQGIALLPWSPLARGRLARAGAAQTSRRASVDDVADSLYGNESADADIYAALRRIAGEIAESPATVALAWLLAKGMSPIIGATAVRHIDDAVRATEIQLSPDQIARLERPYTAKPLSLLPFTAKNQATMTAASFKPASSDPA